MSTKDARWDVTSLAARHSRYKSLMVALLAASLPEAPKVTHLMTKMDERLASQLENTA